MIESFYVDCQRVRIVQATVNGRVTDTKNYKTIIGYLGSRTQMTNQISGKYTIDSEYKFYCNDFDLKFGDYIIYENKNFQVISHPQNTVHKNHHIKAIVKHIMEVT